MGQNINPIGGDWCPPALPFGRQTIPDYFMSADPTQGEAPLLVNFALEANVNAGPCTFEWDFGDGSSSNAQNPTHTYIEPGEYEATVTITNAFGSQTLQSGPINADPTT